ncbi:MAG: RsmE family RNA methyltransferase, partial [Planctomycetaceae bacterium]
PLQTERSAVAPGEGKLQKARRAVIEAAKQCGASRLMEIGGVTGWESLLDRRKEEGRDLLVAHPGGVPLAEAFALADSDAPLFAIGPEGGFTGDEISAARSAGALLVDLGPQHLRVETAAVAVAAYARLAGSPG